MKPANNGAKNTADGPEYVAPMLGEDGLPSVGQKIGPGDPLWCAFVENCNEHIIGAHKDTGECLRRRDTLSRAPPVVIPGCVRIDPPVPGATKTGKILLNTELASHCVILADLSLGTSFRHDMVRKVFSLFYGLNVICRSASQDLHLTSS